MSFYYRVVRVLCTAWVQVPYQAYGLQKIFLTILWVLVSVFAGLLLNPKAFNFDEIQITSFVFCAFGGHILETVA